MWALVPRPRIEPTTPASHRECRVLPTGQPREVPLMALLIMKCKAKVFSKMEAFDLNLPKGKDVSHVIDWSQLRSMKEQERWRSRRWLGSEPPWAEGKAPEEMFQQQNCSGARCRGARGWSWGPGQGQDTWVQNTWGCPLETICQMTLGFSEASWQKQRGSPQRWLRPSLGRGAPRGCGQSRTNVGN